MVGCRISNNDQIQREEAHFEKYHLLLSNLLEPTLSLLHECAGATAPDLPYRDCSLYGSHPWAVHLRLLEPPNLCMEGAHTLQPDSPSRDGAPERLAFSAQRLTMLCGKHCCTTPNRFQKPSFSLPAPWAVLTQNGGVLSSLLDGTSRMFSSLPT